MTKPTIDELEARIEVLERALRYFNYNHKPLLYYGEEPIVEDNKDD